MNPRTSSVTVAPSCGGIGCLFLILGLAILFNVGGIATAISHAIWSH